MKDLIAVSTQTIVIAVVTIIASIYAIQLIGPLPISISQTTTQKDSTFNVNGESELTIVPDQATIQVGIREQQTSIAAAQNRVNEVVNAISAQLKDLGIDSKDIKTTDYSIYPEYDYSNESRRILGYTVSSNLQIKVRDLANVNQVVDTATKLGANQVGGISFGLAEETEEKLTKQAREEAIQDAKANARELSDLAGMKLGKIVNVAENQGNIGITPVFAREMALDSVAMGGGEPTQVEPGSTTLNYRVVLSYETL